MSHEADNYRGLVDALACSEQESKRLISALNKARSENDQLRAKLTNAQKLLSGIREELLEEECDCPPEWPRCTFCSIRFRIQTALKGAEPEPTAMAMRDDLLRDKAERESQERRIVLMEKVYLQLIGRANVPAQGEDPEEWAKDLKALAHVCAKVFYP